MIRKIAYAAGGIDIPSLPEEIQVALNQVLAGEIELTDFISQMNQFQFSGVYTKFAPEDVVPEHREKVSKPLWSRNIGTLDGNAQLFKGFYTSSVQSSSNAAYYLDVYNASPNLVDQYGPLVQEYPYLEADRDNFVDAEAQFAVAFGQYLGHGSKSTEATDNSATKAIYSQYRNILLDPLDDKFTFDATKDGGGDSDNVFFINVNRARYKEKLDPGNWELRLARPNTRLGTFKVVTHQDHIDGFQLSGSVTASNWDQMAVEGWKYADQESAKGQIDPSDKVQLWFVSGSKSILFNATSASIANGATGSGAMVEFSASTTTGTGTSTYPFTTEESWSYGNTEDFDNASVGTLYRHFGAEGCVRELTDDSKAQVSHRIKAGQRVFDVISGSIESEADLGAADFIYTPTSSNSYGLFYPDIGVFALNANAFTSSFGSGGLSIQTGTGDAYSTVGHTLNVGSDFYDIDGNNAGLFFNMIQGGYKFQARSEETVTSTHFFCRVKNKQYNFSNNPTFYTASDGSFTNDDFFKNPRSYITTVGLYNDANELLAVAKLSKPLLKSFDREAVVKVKLDF